MKFLTITNLAISCLCFSLLDPVILKDVQSAPLPYKQERGGIDFQRIPSLWEDLTPILAKRLEQSSSKMKLSYAQVENFIGFLINLHQPTPALVKLKDLLPKTTIDLLRAMESRGVSLAEAEKIAEYLENFCTRYQFKRTTYFDENTSYIVGREWWEIDYTGENMTWQEQQKKYKTYGVVHFKSFKMLKKFFLVEAKLPYFKKIYQPNF